MFVIGGVMIQLFALICGGGGIIAAISAAYAVEQNLTDSALLNLDYEGKVRLINGKDKYEGTLQIFHLGKWGFVCDDQWNMANAHVVCRQLGYVDAYRFTNNAEFSSTNGGFYWLDNVKCVGDEKFLNSCSADVWGRHDCIERETAGVVCRPTSIAITPKSSQMRMVDKRPKQTLKDLLTRLNLAFDVQIQGGRGPEEGQVVISFDGNVSYSTICADFWTLREASVACRHAGFEFAEQAFKTSLFQTDEQRLNLTAFPVECRGDEENFYNCTLKPIDQQSDNHSYTTTCSDQSNVAAVICTNQLPDLVLDLELLRDSAYLHDLSLFYLQCALEENCLASAAYEWSKQADWYYRMRRLMRFSTRVFNRGDVSFRPIAPRDAWQWHQCHMHYHSMEIFSHYDIFDSETLARVAEGHKASFCLEDVDCENSREKLYSCKNFGAQGISVGCWDQYLHDIDCQWIDISELKSGSYIFKVSINPEMQVAEKNFSNNAVACDMYYNLIQIHLSDCRFETL